jgi:hypothetical protein
MGGASLKMQQMPESANPVFRSLASNVSIAFEIMQVSNWRRASRSASVSNDLTAIYVSFQETELTSTMEIRSDRSFDSTRAAAPF